MIEKAHILRQLIEKAAASLTDDKALTGVELFPEWEVGHLYFVGDRFKYNQKLFRVRTQHTSQSDWSPGMATASLYEEVTLPCAGTANSPIAYSGNMTLENGKFYTQGGVTYRCTRDTGIPVYHNLSALVGLYVEVCA